VPEIKRPTFLPDLTQTLVAVLSQGSHPQRRPAVAQRGCKATIPGYYGAGE